MVAHSFVDRLTASVNRKGVLDLDAYKGCDLGIKAHGEGGCYGVCYAAKIAKLNGYDFSKGNRRKVQKNEMQSTMFCKVSAFDVYKVVKNHGLDWFRIGTMGDPSHSWSDVVDICECLSHLKTPVIVTKHWLACSEEELKRLKACKVVLNTSVSALDSSEELTHRVAQHMRFSAAGIKSVLRVVSCRFGQTEKGNSMRETQREIFKLGACIDNPLRIPDSHYLVKRGDVLVSRKKDMAVEVSVSIDNENTYLGSCVGCPDQCGLTV